MGYEAKVESLRKAIAAIDYQLNGTLTQEFSALTSPPKPSVLTPGMGSTTKRRKGQNLRTIMGFLGALSGKGATVAELSKETRVPISSTVAVLKKGEKVFEKGSDGLWRLR